MVERQMPFNVKSYDFHTVKHFISSDHKKRNFGYLNWLNYALESQYYLLNSVHSSPIDNKVIYNYSHVTKSYASTNVLDRSLHLYIVKFFLC